MNRPDYTHGYLRLPHGVWREIYCRAPLTRRQLQLVSVVLRESWGWQTRDGQVYLWTRPLTPRQFAEATGLSTDHLACDLRTLVARGVLLEREGRYQFVADCRHWSDANGRSPEPRPSTLKQPVHSAESALLPPVLKTAQRGNRNVPPASRTPISTAVDESRSRSRRASSAQPVRNLAPLRVEARFLAVIDGFVGGLSPTQRADLRTWIRQDGVAAVWRGLEGVFGDGPDAVRRCLTARRSGMHRSPRRGDPCCEEDLDDPEPGSR